MKPFLLNFEVINNDSVVIEDFILLLKKQTVDKRCVHLNVRIESTPWVLCPTLREKQFNLECWNRHFKIGKPEESCRGSCGWQYILHQKRNILITRSNRVRVMKRILSCITPGHEQWGCCSCWIFLTAQKDQKGWKCNQNFLSFRLETQLINAS